LNITVYSQFAGGDRYGMVHGTYCLAREWVKSGDKVVIVSASFSHTRHTQPEVGISLFKKEIYSGITYIWIKTFKHKPNNLVMRLVNIFVYTILSSLYAVFQKKRDDSIVICSSHHSFAIFPSLITAMRNKARLVYEIRDLWPLSLLHIAGLSKYHPLYLVMKWCEKFAIKRSDIVISVLENADMYVKTLGLEKPVAYIPNGSSESYSSESDLPNSYKAHIKADKQQGNLVVVYAGSIGYANRLSEIIESVNELSDLAISLYMVGSGAQYQELESTVARFGLQKKVHLLPEINRAGIREFLTLADIAYISYLDSPLYDYGISPTKINDYLNAGLLILFLTNISIGELTNCSSIIQCRNIKELKDNLVSLSQDGERVSSIGAIGVNWVAMNRSYADLARRFKKEALAVKLFRRT
jgi:glycosyltransferase involved in cell wall biosynthesis